LYDSDDFGRFWSRRSTRLPTASGVLVINYRDLDRAYENLKRAIEIEPRNRIIAGQDPDLAPLANRPPFDGLLYPEKKNW
jgi:hypothetical protein